MTASECEGDWWGDSKGEIKKGTENMKWASRLTAAPPLLVYRCDTGGKGRVNREQ